MKPYHVDRLAQLALDYSLTVRKGDVLVISGHVIAEAMMCRLFKMALARGALPVIRMTGDLYRETRLRTCGQDRNCWINPLSVPEGSSVDCSLGIWSLADSPPLAGSANGSGSSPPSRDSNEWRRQREFLRAAAKNELRWLALFYPTPAWSRVAGMSVDTLEEIVVNAGLLDHANPSAAWRLMRSQQERLCRQLERGRLVHVTTSLGTDLTLDVTGRTWINGDGRTNLPDGEVFTAPLDSGVTGVFVGDLPVIHEGEIISGVRLEFDGGRLVRSFANRGKDALRRLIGQDEGASRVGEIGLGLNPRLNVPTGLSLLDEKIGGTFHIALGAAYFETGGTNDSLVHRDFVASLHQGGRIEVDGQIINENGTPLRF
jgi:aminopeptidase